MHTRRDYRGWRAEAWRRHEFLDREAVENLADVDCPQVWRQLDAAAVAIRHEPVDNAWQQLHAAEEALAAHASGGFLIDCASQAYEHRHEPGLGARNSFLEVEKAWATVTTTAKGQAVAQGTDAEVARDVAHVLRHAHWVTDQRHVAQNDCHRRLRNAGIGAALVSVLLVAATLAFSDLKFLVASDAFSDVPAWHVVGLVVLGGFVGGMWGAVPAYVDAKPDRYRMLDVRAWVRLSLGVLSALLGVSLLGAGWVSGLSGETASSLFAVALAFGLVQEPVTRTLEKKIDVVTAPKEPSAA